MKRVHPSSVLWLWIKYQGIKGPDDKVYWTSQHEDIILNRRSKPAKTDTTSHVIRRNRQREVQAPTLHGTRSSVFVHSSWTAWRVSKRANCECSDSRPTPVTDSPSYPVCKRRTLLYLLVIKSQKSTKNPHHHKFGNHCRRQRRIVTQRTYLSCFIAGDRLFGVMSPLMGLVKGCFLLDANLDGDFVGDRYARTEAAGVRETLQ